ncbi:mitochondrial glycoprotein, partial [Chytridium lagenaria]
MMRLTPLLRRAAAVAPRMQLATSRMPAFIAPRSFSVSAFASSHGKAEGELKFEESGIEKSDPVFVDEFKKKNIFKIEDKVGEKEISLEEEKNFPINVTILVEKKGAADGDAGAMEITAVAQDKAFLIESVTFSSSSSLVNDQTAEGDWQRRGRYGGPVFTDLDDDLQDLFHGFLKERGFDEELAEFIPSYIVHKSRM